jgi:hypothetical protein
MVAYHQGGEHKAGVKPTYRFQAVVITLTTRHMGEFLLRVKGLNRSRGSALRLAARPTS